MKRADSNGIEIAYEDIGEGEPAVVLIHGAFGDRTHYARVAAHLAHRHRVIALDLRGHGESAVPRDGFQMNDFARDVLAVCRRAGVKRAVLCGHSWGIALVAAALAPELTAGVVLLDPAILFPEPRRRSMLEALVPALDGAGRVQALSSFFRRMVGAYDPPELWSRIVAGIEASPAHIAAPLMRDVATRDLSPELAAGRYPLLVVHATTPVDLAELKRLRPDAIVAEVAGSGHYVMLVVPEQVNAMLDRFLEILPLVVAP